MPAVRFRPAPPRPAASSRAHSALLRLARPDVGNGRPLFWDAPQPPCPRPFWRWKTTRWSPANGSTSERMSSWKNSTIRWPQKHSGHSCPSSRKGQPPTAFRIGRTRASVPTSIAEVAVDKVSVELPAPRAGVLRLLVPEEEVVRQGAPIARTE